MHDGGGTSGDGVLIKARQLYKEFPIKGSRSKITAIDRVDLELMDGETLGLIGESGSGKSTVGRCLMNTETPTSGSITFRDIRYETLGRREANRLRRNMQMVFQDPYYSLNPRRTVRQAVEGAINVAGSPTAAERQAMVDRAFMRAQVDPAQGDRYPHQMSLGQLQRVCIARAVVSNPTFVVLDEPTSSLDATVRGEILELLAQLQREQKMTFLFISHDLSTVRYLCDRVAVMYLASIVEIGSTRQIFTEQRHPYSRALLSSVNIANPRLRGPRYRLSGEIPSPVNIPRGCPLASRCPEVMVRCTQERPRLKEIVPGHATRCFLYHDEAEKPVS